MGEEINHNKIINQAARKVLKPCGLFQKGQSRTWIDDNGWFLIVVEFQPSAWDKGSYLNVAINYLWSEKDYLSFDYGHRVNEFVAFSGDEIEFYSGMVLLSERALEKVEEYRCFKDMLYAKEQILGYNGHSSLSHEIYNKMMICGLIKDDKARVFYKKLEDNIKDSQLGWEKEYYTELSEKIAPVIEDAELFYEYVINKIKRQREYWHNKASMKKLREGNFEIA